MSDVTKKWGELSGGNVPWEMSGSRLRPHVGSIIHPERTPSDNWGLKCSENPCDFQTDRPRFCTTSDIKGKNNFTQFNVANVKLQPHDKVGYYLATVNIREL